jgi:GAF domain-containing protein
MALRDPVHHRQPQAGAALALGREEGLQATATRLLVHTDARVAHFDLGRLRFADCTSAQRQFATLGHRVHGVEQRRLISASRISRSRPLRRPAVDRRVGAVASRPPTLAEAERALPHRAGALYLLDDDGGDGSAAEGAPMDERARLASALAEQCGLALANIRMRNTLRQ